MIFIARLGSLVYQFTTVLSEQQSVGNSFRHKGGKHAAKKQYRQEQTEKGEAWNPAYADGVFSHDTYQAYANSLKQFSVYLKAEGIKDIREATREHAVGFLRAEVERGLSASTVSLRMAAINKIYDHEITKHDTGAGNRSDHEITRGRLTVRDETYLQREKSNMQQIEFTKAFGTRRQSIEPSPINYPVKPVSLFQRDGEVYCSLIEKGGKYREVQCLQAHKEAIMERYKPSECDQERSEATFKQMYHESKEETLFSKYDKNVNNHGYRAEYAQELYKQVESEWIDEGRSIEIDFNGYNREIACEVSFQLGHGKDRPSLFVNHYSKESYQVSS